jgi:hypothetical protein
MQNQTTRKEKERKQRVNTDSPTHNQTLNQQRQGSKHIHK